MSDRPKRIQRSRAKGWRMPEGAVYVGRPTMWGNPFVAGMASGVFSNPAETMIPALTIGQALHFYREMTGGFLCPEMYPHGHEHMRLWNKRVKGMSVREAARVYLKGKDLCCWCPLVDEAGNPVPCHADILLESANSPSLPGEGR